MVRGEARPSQPDETLVAGDLDHLVESAPAKGIALVVPLLDGAFGRDHHEPNVEVDVFGYALARGDGVDVAVDRRGDEPKPLDTGLLGGLFERDAAQVALAVGVTARLQPLSELRVQHQQGAFAFVVEDERAPGQVALEAGAVQSVVVDGNEVEDLRPRLLRCRGPRGRSLDCGDRVGERSPGGSGCHGKVVGHLGHATGVRAETLGFPGS